MPGVGGTGWGGVPLVVRAPGAVWQELRLSVDGWIRSLSKAATGRGRQLGGCVACARPSCEGWAVGCCVWVGRWSPTSAGWSPLRVLTLWAGPEVGCWWGVLEGVHPCFCSVGRGGDRLTSLQPLPARPVAGRASLSSGSSQPCGAGGCLVPKVGPVGLAVSSHLADLSCGLPGPWSGGPWSGGSHVIGEPRPEDSGGAGAGGGGAATASLGSPARRRSGDLLSQLCVEGPRCESQAR